MPSQTKVEADLLFSLFKLGYSCWVQTELNSSFFWLVLHIIELNHVWFISFFLSLQSMNIWTWLELIIVFVGPIL